MTTASSSGGPQMDSPPMDDSKSNPAKVFIGGLGQQTTDESLRVYFGQFGVVEDAAVVIDKANGRSRGFGFCTFTDPQSASHCLNQRHKIDGVSCEVRRAVPRELAADNAPYDTVSQPSKVFVGGLTEDVTEEQLSQYFIQFGHIKESTLMYDKTSHRPRGFGFVTFETVEDARRTLGPHPSLCAGCEVKLAEPRPSPNSQRYRNGKPRYEDETPRSGVANWGGRPIGRRTGYPGPYERSYDSYGPRNSGAQQCGYGHIPQAASHYGSYEQSSAYGGYKAGRTFRPQQQYGPYRNHQRSDYLSYNHNNSVNSSQLSYYGGYGENIYPSRTMQATSGGGLLSTGDPYASPSSGTASSVLQAATYQQLGSLHHSQAQAYNYDPYAAATSPPIATPHPTRQNPYGASPSSAAAPPHLGPIKNAPLTSTCYVPTMSIGGRGGKF